MTNVKKIVGVFAVLALTLGLALMGSTASAREPQPGDPDFAYQLTTKVFKAKKRVVGSSEATNSTNQLALQYKPTRSGKWKVVASRMGDETKNVVRVTKKNARKGFYRTRISVSGIDCSSEPCTTKTFYYFSSVKRLR